jgi:DNA-binding beta-propeller fold protein YncE
MQNAATESGGESVVGGGQFRYEVREGWGRLPVGWSLVEVAGVATDSRDRVHVFNRGEHPVIVFDRDGKFLNAWGEGLFRRPHGIHIGPDDTIFLCDDLDHTVQRFTSTGKLLQKLGRSGEPSDTGATSVDYRTIQRAGPPFHFPCNVALGAGGEMYVADGYGNARVHKFSADGELLLSWGVPGSAPGEFHLPHGIAVDREGVVYVADRENSRVQRFTPDGKFLGEWPNIARPCQVFIDSEDNVYVAEVGYRAGMWPGSEPPCANPPGGRVSIFNTRGELKARWGGGDNPCAPGDFYAPHDVWADSHGDLYVGEVIMSAGGYRGLVSPDCHSLQKFVRLR